MSPAAQAFVDPSNGRTYTWRHLLARVRRKVSNRVPSVGRTQLDDCLQLAIGDLAIAIGSTPSRYVDAPSGLYVWGECVDLVRRRTLQRIAREARKAAHELDALARADAAGVRAALGSLSSAGANPQDVTSNRDLYNRVASWFAALPDRECERFALVLDGRTQQAWADELGISRQAVAKRQAALRAELRALAVSAGFLERGMAANGEEGTYEREQDP